MDTKKAYFYLNIYRKFVNAYNNFIVVEFSDYVLSPNEIVVLSSLSETSKASEIAKQADVSKALVSRSVSLLKSKKLVNIDYDLSDKREQIITLTAEGQELAKRIELAKEKFVDIAFKDFSKDELDVLKALLVLIGKNLNILED